MPERHIKYLGVIIDSHLKWDKHVEFLIKKLRGLLPKFKLCKQFCDIEQLKVLYHALVRSHLTYGIIGWGGITNHYLSRLEVVHKWIIKIMYNKCYTYSTDDLYNESGLLDPRQLYCQNLLMYQYKQKSINVYIEHSHETRYKDHSFQIPKVSKTAGQRCHMYLGPKIYKSLPLNIKLIQTRNNFKSKVHKWILASPRIAIHKLVDIKNTYP